jgi:nucleoside-diphosphate-sugar epimerase
VLRACEARTQVAGEVINVATAGRISLNELVSVMNAIVGTNLQAVYKEERAGDVKDSQADISKAKALLGYAPIVGLEEGLRHTIEWCRHSSPAPAGR